MDWASGELGGFIFLVCLFVSLFIYLLFIGLSIY